ncbi:MAG: hypothetical protein GY797_32885, partial [Deltaproteobacteria bacterium]|nr:hypothetical protein [Deltaproteobacteria bacterium]
MTMQRAPWNYECSYQHNCPHLEGLSTQWVFGEYQRSNDEHIEHWRVRDILEEDIEDAYKRIDKLESENEELKAKLKALHRRQFKSNTKRNNKSQDKSGTEKPVNPKQKKRGAPLGHPGWYRRKPDHID